jgi:hypothetical protein
MILDHYAILKNRDVRRNLEFSIPEPRGIKDDVVVLPLAGFARSVHERRVLAVNRSGLPIGIDQVPAALEYLQFVNSEEEDSAIPLPLVAGPEGRGGPPLDVQLDVAVLFARIDITTLWDYLYVAVLHFPTRGIAFCGSPHGKILPIEENLSIRGREARTLLRAASHALDFDRLRTLGVVDMPFAAGQHGCVLIAHSGFVLPALGRTQQENAPQKVRSYEDYDVIALLHGISQMPLINLTLPKPGSPMHSPGKSGSVRLIPSTWKHPVAVPKANTGCGHM